MSYLTKLKGSPAAIPPSPSFKEVGFISIGAFLAASVIGFLAYYTKQPIIMGSFGVSIFVLFVLPDFTLCATKKCHYWSLCNNAYWV